MSRRTLISMVLFGAVLIFGLAIFFLLNTFTEKKIGQNPLIIPEPISVDTDGKAEQNVAVDTTDWQRSGSENIEITHPKDWSIQSSPIQGGGAVVTLEPTQKIEGNAFPRIDIMSFPFTSPAQSQNLISQVEGFGFIRENSVITGLPVVLLTAVIKAEDFVQGNLEGKDVMKKVYILQDGNYVYQIDYAYYMDQDISRSEAVIKKIISTLDLK